MIYFKLLIAVVVQYWCYLTSVLHLTLLIIKTFKNTGCISRRKGRSSQMVFIISERPCSICTNRIYFLSRAKSVVWSCSRLSPGASTFQNLHSPSWKNNPEAWVNIPPICWWHSARYGIQTIWLNIWMWLYISDRGLRGRETDMDGL